MKLHIIILMIIGSFPALNIPAQETFEKEIILKSGQSVKLDLKFAQDVTVKTWDKKKLFVKAVVEHNFEEELDFKLLEYNDSEEVEIEEKIKNLEDQKKNYINGYNHNCIKLDIKYEVYLPADIELEVKSISGNIEAKSMKNALILETISGFVDIALDDSGKYTIKCSTISGSIYSDMKFDSGENIKADIVGSKLNTNINGGGKKIRLKSISGDLYLRKR